MKTDVYSFKTYTTFLRSALPSSGPDRGAKRRLAQALGCQPAFISQVLAEKAHLSLEAALLTASFLSLNKEETQFFLLLLQKDRAGSHSLKEHFEDQLRLILFKREEIRTRISSSDSLTVKEMSIYYENWIYAAVHMCCLIPRLGTESAIAKYLGVRIESVYLAVEKLVDLGIIIRRSGQLKSGRQRLHLGQKNLSLKQHHTNWRLRAIDSLGSNDPTDLHYTSVMSVSAEAAKEIRSRILKLIQEAEPLIKEARDEQVFALNFDLFGLG